MFHIKRLHLAQISNVGRCCYEVGKPVNQPFQGSSHHGDQELVAIPISVCFEKVTGWPVAKLLHNIF